MRRTLPSRWLAALLLFVSFLIPLPLLAESTITQPLHGPERLDYSTSTYSRTFTCPSTQGSFTLNVVNGDGNGNDTVSSANIYVNGTKIIKTSDFNSNTTQINKAVTNLVSGNNTLAVQINTSSPSSYLIVTLTGIYTLDVRITSPLGGALLNTTQTAVQGTYLAYSTNFNITVDNVSATTSSGVFNVPVIPLVSGSNLIQAVITTADGLTDQDNVTVNDNLPPVADAGSSQNVRTEDNVYLDGRGSSDPENATISYQWSFLSKPAGSQSALSGADTVGPYFVPDLDGSYVARLIVNDGIQDSNPDSVLVTAVHPNAQPTAVAGPDQNVTTGSQIFLDGSGSFDPDADPITYSWSFIAKPQTSLAELSNPLIAAPSFTADASGVYVAELVVGDGTVNSTPDNVTVVAVPPNTPPTAYAGQDAVAIRNVLSNLEGSESFDPEGSTLSYAWTLISRPAGSLAVLDNATTVSPSFLPDLAGDYVFRLVVNDGVFDSPPDTIIVTAVNVPPVALATAASSSVPVNSTISLDGSRSHDANGDPLSFAWSMISTPPGSLAAVSPPASAYPSLTLDLAGDYTIQLIVNDGQATSAPATVAVSAFIPPVTVPDVVGMPQSSAQDLIVGAGLIVGAISPASSDTVPSGNVISQTPLAGATIPPGSAVNLSVSSGPLMVPVPVLLGMTQAEAEVCLGASQLSLGTISNAYSATVAIGRAILQNPKSGTMLSHGSPVALVISLGPEAVVIPPDPASVAPTLPNRTVTTVAAASQFLYSGENPIQSGVASGVIEPKCAAVLHGKVLGENGQPLSGVVVTILSRPEFGRTISRVDGAYDMVINGGGQLVVCFDKPGFLPAQRTATPTWQTYEFLADVMLVTLDNQVTVIDPASPDTMQLARGSEISDERGTRQATILFPQGTQGQAVFPDGSIRPLASMSIRATEYTVGPNGQKRMPASLPPTTGYTYAVELSVDEAFAMGAEHIVFNRPVSFYLENFLGFPVGSGVPVGIYDKVNGYWIPEPDGRIIKIVSIVDGYANIDLNGDGIMDNTSALTAFGIEEAERGRLAALYESGASLWRVSMTHFSTMDLNYGLACAAGSDGCQNPKVATDNTGGAQGQPDVCLSEGTQPGSIIDCPSQNLGEKFPISGTPFSLNYSSGQMLGRVQYATIDIPLVGSAIPFDLKQIILRISIGGVLYEFSDNTITPNMVRHFVWDGKDSAGRKLLGVQKAKIDLEYVYPTVYTGGWVDCVINSPMPGIPISFGLNVGEPTTISGPDLLLTQSWETFVKLPDVRTRGFGGWTISDHHEYDPVGLVLDMGDGRSRTASDRNLVINTFIRSGFGGDGGAATQASASDPSAMKRGPDGSVYFIDRGNRRIRHIDTKGIIHTVAGNGGFDNDVDGIPAIQASVAYATDLAIGSDNSIFFSEQSRNRIRRIRPSDGIITTYAGTGECEYWEVNIGDWGPAGLAKLCSPIGLASGLGDGSLYVADSGNGRVRRISSNGFISTVAGGGWFEPGTQPISGQAASLAPRYIAAGQGGSLYVSSEIQDKIFRISSNNQVVTIAGTGQWGAVGEGIPAVQSELRGPSCLDVNPADGSIYFIESSSYRIRRIGSDGILTTVAGDGFGLRNYQDGMMARQVTLSLPLGILSEPDGSFYVPNTDLGYGHDGVYRVQPSMPGLSGADYLIASEDGQELYLFDDQGRHYRTLDARTGLTHRQFEYDSSGLLSRLFDADNNLVVIEREVPGNIVIVAPGGQRTLLILDENGYVQEVRNLASGDRVQLTHRENGLLEHLVDWRGYDHWFEYEASTGRLVYDRDPAMGVTAKTLTRSVLPDSSAVVDFKSPLDRATRYGFEIPMTGANRNMTSASAKELVSTVTIGSDGITPALGPGMTRYTTVNPTGSRVITLVDDNGVETRNDASGTITNLERQPDPRFGMQAPYPRQIITYTPQGLVSTTTLTKTIELASPADISALLSESEIVTVNNRIYSTSFDNSTRQIVSNSPEGRVAVFTLDDKGRIASILPDSRLLPAIRHYDEKGRLDRTGQDNVFWTYVYDDNNRLHQVRSPMGDNTVYGYDNADRVNSIQLPSGRSYGFEYDASGNRTKIVMPNMAEHRLGYSPVNLDNGYTPPANPSYTHGYSLDREWKRTTLPSGRQVTATYGDNTGRLETIAWWEGNVTFGYQDNDDRVWSITRTDNTAQQFPQQVMNYDFDGSLIKKVASSGLANGEYRYIYDNNFFLTRVALDNVWNLLSRDNDGLLTGFGPFTISRGGPSGSPDNVSDLSPRDCGLDGDEQPIQCPTGWLVQSFGYDNVGRLDRRTSTINGNVVYEEMLERDPVGRISIKTETVAGTAPVIFEYFYDVDGQLDNVVRDYVLYEKYGYDLNGNRTLAHGPAAPWQDGVPFDNQDRETGASVSFDMDGNLVQRGSRNFTYSARGELLTVTDTGIPVVSYAYDGMNRRIAGTNADNQTTQYLYGNLGQPFQVTASIAPDNVLTNYFYDDFGALYALERGGVRYYVASDHLGTPKVVTDNAGNVLRVMAYDSWGVKTYDNNATFDLLVGFAGGLVDNGTNLVRFGYRDYEPQTGRWLSKDPIFHKGGLNLYQYCGNDPVNWKDPSGLWWSDKAWPWVRDKAAPAVKNFIENAVPAVLHDLVGAIYGAGTIAPEVNSAAIDAAVGRYNIEESAKENPDYIDPSWAHENPGAAYDLLLKRKKACKLKR